MSHWIDLINENIKIIIIIKIMSQNLSNLVSKKMSRLNMTVYEKNLCYRI